MESGNGGGGDCVGTIGGGKEEREVVEKGTIRQSGWKEENWRDGGQLRRRGDGGQVWKDCSSKSC